jgi:hypothetical protein
MTSTALTALTELYEAMKALAAKHDIVIVTAKQAPRLNTFNHPVPTPGVIIIDYIDILEPKCASTPS